MRCLRLSRKARTCLSKLDWGVWNTAVSFVHFELLHSRSRRQNPSFEQALRLSSWFKACSVGLLVHT